MKAKEIANKRPIYDWSKRSNRKKELKTEIINYAKQKCKEQREICNKNQLRCFADGQPDFEYILNAPEPEFE